MDESLDNWFAREILAHEGALVRFLMRAWPHRDELHDLRQEVYIRVFESAMQNRPSSPKSFMFTTARNLMADRIRRGRVVSIEVVGDVDALNVLIDEVSPEQRLSARHDLKRLSEAFDRLPARCREVVWLRRVEELSQKEVAVKLGITEKTVEKQISKGARLIAGYFFGDSQSGLGRRGGVLEAQKESRHGNQQTD
jgi:RNA polymerase sigma factor (sigma-70 family)